MQGDTVAILALGDFYQLRQKRFITKLKEKLNVNATLINPVYITGVDDKTLDGIKEKPQNSNNARRRNFGRRFCEKIARFYGASDIKTINYGIKKAFYDRFKADELLKENGVYLEKIVGDIESVLKGKNK